MNPEWTNALIGGILIGLSVSLMMVCNGRVTGISGILYGALRMKGSERYWRLALIGGLVVGGAGLHFFKPEFFGTPPVANLGLIFGGGLLVGFGTTLGNGCTSGHGVCGISRLSKRSILATCTFMIAGALTVFALRRFGALP